MLSDLSCRLSYVLFSPFCSVDFLSHTSKERGDSASPKFIVTLDGVPSPLGNLADCEMELDDVRPPTKVTEAIVHANREPKVSVLHRLQGGITSAEGVGSSQNNFFTIIWGNTASLYILSSSDRWHDGRRDGGGWCRPFKETEGDGALQVLAGL